MTIVLLLVGVCLVVLGLVWPYLTNDPTKLGWHWVAVGLLMAGLITFELWVLWHV